MRHDIKGKSVHTLDWEERARVRRVPPPSAV
jgi:hypothetical protein